MRKIILTLFIVLNTAVSYCQVQEAWLQIYNTPNNLSERPAGIAVDAAGNSHVLTGKWANPAKVLKYGPNGDFLWIADVGFSPEAITLDASGNVYVATSGGIDFFIYKINSAGVLIWTKTYDFGGSHDEAKAIVVDNSGNVYVVGKAADINDDYDLTDFGLVKYNSNGDFQWARTYNGSDPGQGLDFATGVALDATGNIYVTGTSQLNGQLDYATLKYNPAGVLQWVRRYNAPEGREDYAGEIVIDANDNIYVGGTVEGELYSGNEWFTTDLAIVKYNTNGDQQWATLVSRGTHDIFEDMLVDGTGNIFIASYYEITAPGTLLVSKINSSGVIQWASNSSPSAEGRDSRIANDGSGNVYVVATRPGDETYSDIVTIKFNSNGGQVWMMHFLGGRYGDDAKAGFIAVDANESVFMACILNGLEETGDDAILHKYTQCTITCPSNIIVNADAGKCDAVINYSAATTSGYCGSDITYSHASGSTFPVGITTVTIRSTETGAECSFTITVNDAENPVITNCPSNKTVSTDPGVCYATAASVNAGSASATDNCNPVEVVGVRSDGALLSANYPVGITTIVWTATDPSGNTATCSQTITVVDDIPPTISGETSSTYILSPPNHTMRDVTINYTATDNCSVTTQVTVSSNEPINGVGDGDTDPDYIVLDNVPGAAGQYVSHLQLRAERAAGGTGRIYTVTITATDPYGNTTIKTIDIQVPHDIKKPHGGQAFKVGSTVSFEGEFWDKPGNTHTAKWMIDGSTAAKATVTEPSGGKNGKVTGSYKFTTPGVYKLQMNVTDQNVVTHYATTAGDIEAIVVIYDPNGGYTYGGGYFNSPAGALKSNPSATGKASYGFAMNYFKNSTYPKGETQFEFKVGSFEFNALNFEYLAINNSTAQFKGTGKIIGGQSGVAFTMTVVDGELDGTGLDKIRMKIYNKNNGQVIYDNQPGASDAALPAQAVGANSIIVIGVGAKSSSAVITEQPIVRLENNLLIESLEVGAFPNPHQGTFSLRVQSPVVGKITIEYFTMTGARIYAGEQQVKAHEQILVPNTGLKFNGTIFYKVSINGIIKTGKIIGIN